MGTGGSAPCLRLNPLRPVDTARMRLVSFGERGAERAGVLHRDGMHLLPVHTLDRTLPDNVRALVAGGHLSRLRTLVAQTRKPGVPLAGVRLGPPVTDPTKIVCIGLNFKGHAAEQDKPWPEQPLLFAKAPTALCGPEDDIVLPEDDCGPDYEVELVAVIGRRARHVAAGEALAHVAGWCVGNDVSGRKWQKSDGQFFRAKSCDTFFPCGPALVTTDEIADLPALRLTTRIAGELLQDATVADLIHDVPTLIAYISRFMTLEPGDLISTGTPAGVGCYRSPPRFLGSGDTVTCAIDGAVGLGRLVNRVIAADVRTAR
jgi:2-keto-4-pentenoate hydratase/2-oxohepta-3-ene-1,7-dioic acid hydratase in catechol pathway